MKLGTLVTLKRDDDIDAKIGKVSELGFEYCQISCWDMGAYTDEMAEKIIVAIEKYGVKISTFWCGWSGKCVWNFYEGPLTLGLVPEAFRYARTCDLKAGSDFAKKLGVTQIATHAGFLPEDPNSEKYRGVLCALREVAEHCKANNQLFLFETGQETPTTLKRTIEDIGLDNVGINLDPANLLLYGKANPVDAVDIFGEYVRDVHAKDGCYPTDGRELGKEMPIGQGRVNFPELVKKLKEKGYDATLIIEREIKGEKQRVDILAGKEFLEKYI